VSRWCKNDELKRDGGTFPLRPHPDHFSTFADELRWREREGRVGAKRIKEVVKELYESPDDSFKCIKR
jgi:hypothetical protein